MVKNENEFKLTDHEMVPTHEAMMKKDADQLMKDLNINENQIPTIRKDDAIIKEMEIKPGTIVKITRKSQTAGKSIYYRIVK